MAESGIDVLMKIVSKAGGMAMPGESRTVFAIDKLVDRLRAGFEPGMFCELMEFSFAAGVGSSRSEGDEDMSLEGMTSQQQDTFKRMMEKEDKALKRESKKKRNEPVDMQPVEFTRILDTSSTLLFQALVACDTLDSISIVKRKAAGTSNSGEIFLRMDFTKVLMTDLQWKDAELHVEETGTFIYRQLQIRYRPQKPDGTLGDIVPMTWKMQSA